MKERVGPCTCQTELFSFGILVESCNSSGSHGNNSDIVVRVAVCVLLEIFRTQLCTCHVISAWCCHWLEAGLTSVARSGCLFLSSHRLLSCSPSCTRFISAREKFWWMNGRSVLDFPEDLQVPGWRSDSMLALERAWNAAWMDSDEADNLNPQPLSSSLSCLRLTDDLMYVDTEWICLVTRIPCDWSILHQPAMSQFSVFIFFSFLIGWVKHKLVY